MQHNVIIANSQWKTTNREVIETTTRDTIWIIATVTEMLTTKIKPIGKKENMKTTAKAIIWVTIIAATATIIDFLLHVKDFSNKRENDGNCWHLKHFKESGVTGLKVGATTCDGKMEMFLVVVAKSVQLMA